MIFTTTDRQGFNKDLSGVVGSAIQSAYHKPIMEPSHAFANISWLPYPYGELPDKGPWIDKENKENEELPTPDTLPNATPWTAKETPSGNVFMFAAVICAVLLLTSRTKFFK